MKIQQEVFFGPIFCASLYGALHNTPVAHALAGETDAIKKISIALKGILGEKASGLGISHITSGKGRVEILEHVNKIEQLLQGQFEFEVNISANQENFYLSTGQPRGYYIEGLMPEDEKILNNLFLKQYLIISSSEMKALGFDDSNPRRAFEFLNKRITTEDCIILTGKKGNVCVVAESEKLQQLKNALPLPVLVSPAQAIAILYHADLIEQKNSESFPISIDKFQPNPALLSDALNKLSIKCSVDSADSKMLKLVALPEEHARIHQIWDECLQELDINMRQNLHVEIEQIANLVTDKSIAQWFGHNNFVFLPGVAILVKDHSSLQKLRDLRNEWLEINILYLKLLELFFKNPKRATNAKKISIYLKGQKIIPKNLPIDVRESRNRIFKISIPVKYKEKILNHFATLLSEHFLEVTPEVVEILHQQTGIKELVPALTRLQKMERVERGVIIEKDHKNYMIFADENDIDAFKYFWVRRPVSIGSLQKIAVQLEAKKRGCRDDDFKSCCNFLKIIVEHPSNYFNFRCWGVQTEIKIDGENLQNLNLLIANYVLIPPEVYNFIFRFIPDISNYCQGVNDNKQYVISKKNVESVYRDNIPRVFKSTLSGNVMTYPCVVGDDKVCDMEELGEDEGHFSLAILEEPIASWKSRTGFVPMTYQILESVTINLSNEQIQYFIKRRSSSTTQSLSKNTQGFMAARRNSSVSQSGISVDPRDFKGDFGSSHTLGTGLFTTPHSSKSSSPSYSPSGSPLPSPTPSPSSSPNGSPRLNSSSIFGSDFRSGVVSSGCELYTIDLSYS